MDVEKGINIILGSTITIIFIYLYYCNYIVDTKNKKKLQNSNCYKDKGKPNITDEERHKIEYVVHDYIVKSKKNKSNCKKIQRGVMSGVIKGLIGGMVLGNNLMGSMRSASVFGLIGGAVSAFNLRFGKTKYLCEDKHTL